jgi:hypothetical protein
MSLPELYLIATTNMGRQTVFTLKLTLWHGPYPSLCTRSLTRIYLQDVLQPLQGHSDNPHVTACEQVTQRLNAPNLDEVLDLLSCAAGRGIADGPCSFLLDVELRIGQQVHKRGDDLRIDHSLATDKIVVLGAGQKCKSTRLTLSFHIT